jgi:predicted GIY-YIG superfamily endonuclease
MVFTKNYFEETQDVTAAITREKEIKKWRHEKKDNLVSQLNPSWRDLSECLQDLSLRLEMTRCFCTK